MMFQNKKVLNFKMDDLIVLIIVAAIFFFTPAGKWIWGAGEFIGVFLGGIVGFFTNKSSQSEKNNDKEAK